ncbi:hypothetical protein, partial [Streptomyces virginiae]|uniref:hypothetical protein n=1 Tax=Streptomyces virginiae TaxID=1961 RepID=UPI00370485A7
FDASKLGYVKLFLIVVNIMRLIPSSTPNKRRNPAIFGQILSFSLREIIKNEDYNSKTLSLYFFYFLLDPIPLSI